MTTNTVPPRWYVVDAFGMATLCQDETDAKANAADYNECWPNNAPHTAVQLAPIEQAVLEKVNPGWMPIETAPKEGSWALVYAYGAINCMYVQAGKEPEDWTRPKNPNVISGNVTHWMPLPAHPGAQQAVSQDAVDAARYRAIRQAAVDDNRKFLGDVEDHQAQYGKNAYRPTAGEIDAAVDYAIEVARSRVDGVQA